MDKKYLDKVIDQIVRETRIDYDKEKLYTPFSLHSSHLFFLFFRPPSSLSLYFPFPSFPQHCKEVYGLNEDETRYVWGKYVSTLLTL